MIANEFSTRSALRTLEIERKGIAALEAALADESVGALGSAFADAVRIMAMAAGRVIVTGMGKSGHIARKIAATLSSTGRPATFLHPAEASHGDLGMVQSGDVVVAISWSGETAELAAIITYTRRYRIPLIAMTAEAASSLAAEADIVLLLPRAEEACPNGLAPTTSTTMQLVAGDALAVALLESKGFTAQDFKIFHPGGRLGATLAYVRDVMHRGDRIPRVAPDALMAEAILEISSRGFGCVAVCDSQDRVIGIITDGDLRRHMRSDLMAAPAASVMTRAPRTISPNALVAEALEMISRNISALLVVENDLRLIGIVHFHDLLRIGAA